MKRSSITEAAWARCPQAGTSAGIRIPRARATTSLKPCTRSMTEVTPGWMMRTRCLPGRLKALTMSSPAVRQPR